MSEDDATITMTRNATLTTNSADLHVINTKLLSIWVKITREEYDQELKGQVYWMVTEMDRVLPTLVREEMQVRLIMVKLERIQESWNEKY